MEEIDIFFNKKDFEAAYEAGGKEEPSGFDMLSLNGCKNLFQHLDMKNAKGFLDQGCGTGQVLLYVFLTFLNLRTIYGLEVAKARFDLCKFYCTKLMALPGYEIVKDTTTELIISSKKRLLILSNCSLYDYEYPYDKIDIVLSNINIPFSNLENYEQILRRFTNTQLVIYDLPPGLKDNENLEQIRVESIASSNEINHPLYLFRY